MGTSYCKGREDVLLCCTMEQMSLQPSAIPGPSHRDGEQRLENTRLNPSYGTRGYAQLNEIIRMTVMT